MKLPIPLGFQDKLFVKLEALDDFGVIGTRSIEFQTDSTFSLVEPGKFLQKIKALAGRYPFSLEIRCGISIFQMGLYE